MPAIIDGENVAVASVETFHTDEARKCAVCGGTISKRGLATRLTYHHYDSDWNRISGKKSMCVTHLYCDHWALHCGENAAGIGQPQRPGGRGPVPLELIERSESIHHLTARHILERREEKCGVQSARRFAERMLSFGEQDERGLAWADECRAYLERTDAHP